MTDIPSVDQLLPHDDPMILIDRAISVEALSIHCQVDIGDHNLFFDAESQTVPAYVGIEFMAQSVAAWSGYHALKNDTTPQSDSYSALVATNHCAISLLKVRPLISTPNSLWKTAVWLCLPQESKTKASWWLNANSTFTCRPNKNYKK